MSEAFRRLLCAASVANIPFIGAIAVALQFLFVQRRGGMDARNKHTQLAGRTVDKIAARSLDNRCVAQPQPS